MIKTTKQRGVTLIEVLVTMAILLIGIMGFTVAFTNSLMHATAARNDSQALFIALSFVEELKARPFDDWADQGNLDSIEDQFITDFYGNRTSTDGFYEIDAIVDTLEDTVRRVTVTVTWAGALDEQERLGFGSGKTVSDGSTQAFVLESVISEMVSDSIYGEEAGL